jgi:hypothetical protein
MYSELAVLKSRAIASLKPPFVLADHPSHALELVDPPLIGGDEACREERLLSGGQCRLGGRRALLVGERQRSQHRVLLSMDLGTLHGQPVGCRFQARLSRKSAGQGGDAGGRAAGRRRQAAAIW